MQNDALISSKASTGQTTSGDTANPPRQLKTSTLFVAWLFAGPLNPLWLAAFFTIPSYQNSEIVLTVAAASSLANGLAAMLVVMFLSHQAAPSYIMIWRTWLKAWPPIGLFIFVIFAVPLVGSLFILGLLLLPVVALVITGAGLAASFLGSIIMHLVFSVLERR